MPGYIAYPTDFLAKRGEMQCAACGRIEPLASEDEAERAGWFQYWLTAWACSVACFEGLAMREDSR